MLKALSNGPFILLLLVSIMRSLIIFSTSSLTLSPSSWSRLSEYFLCLSGDSILSNASEREALSVFHLDRYAFKASSISALLGSVFAVLISACFSFSSSPNILLMSCSAFCSSLNNSISFSGFVSPTFVTFSSVGFSVTTAGLSVRAGGVSGTAFLARSAASLRRLAIIFSNFSSKFFIFSRVFDCWMRNLSTALFLVIFLSFSLIRLNSLYCWEKSLWNFSNVSRLLSEIFSFFPSLTRLAIISFTLCTTVVIISSCLSTVFSVMLLLIKYIWRSSSASWASICSFTNSSSDFSSSGCPIPVIPAAIATWMPVLASPEKA